ncbi:MAG: cytochrome-c peroxidase [Betaproteobacteria bacterium]|nr:cytochrome-c peroxidase [Betaproteobacteria bacterium]
MSSLSFSRRRTVTAVSALFALAGITGAFAHLGPVPVSLKGVAIPEVPGLTTGPDPIIVNRQKAMILGKALFWDMNVGSDGMACASCHFHAGADARVKNQMAPAGPGGVQAFDMASDGFPRGANYTLKRSDFPFTQSKDPAIEIEVAGLARKSDDVAGSAGTFGGGFRTVELADASADDCSRSADPVFHVGSVGARRVIERNAPSVINAVFNYRNFWDGRANNTFNGSSPWGDRDRTAGVWVKQASGTVAKLRLRLSNSALASQALAPPVSATEMSCANRSLADLGRKLMWRRPLESQRVHASDSVLGPLAYSTGNALLPGLKTYYVTLIREAFNQKFWSSGGRGPFGSPKPTGSGDVPLPYNQFEANFGMFFALALQVYQSTLVSDDSPFDRSRRDAEGNPVDLSPGAIRGMQHFRTAHCNLCHIGPLFTSAAVETNAALVRSNPMAFGTETFTVSTTRNVIGRTPAIKGTGFVDTGFAATGVVEDTWDPGLAGKDAFGNPLSFAEQYLQYLVGNRTAVVDPVVMTVRPCDLQVPIAFNLPIPHPLIFTQVQGVVPQSQQTADCYNPSGVYVPTQAAAAAELASSNNRRMLAVTDAAFKVPSLRNVELTGPYMHNGSMATLDEVVEFYSRGGNFEGRSKQFGMVFPQSTLQLDAQARADVVEFLKSLTDDRVRYERAPFDHPELRVPHGSPGDHTRILGTNALSPVLGDDEFILVPPIGAAGRVDALLPFDTFLAP